MQFVLAGTEDSVVILVKKKNPRWIIAHHHRNVVFNSGRKKIIDQSAEEKELVGRSSWLVLMKLSVSTNPLRKFELFS